MESHKYLFIYHTSSQPRPAPSPEEIQGMLERWRAWKAKFAQEVVDLGDGLKPGGKVLANGVITDGPFAESKDVVGGYSIIAAPSYDRALVVARECPFTAIPGGRIEIRELIGY